MQALERSYLKPLVLLVVVVQPVVESGTGACQEINSPRIYLHHVLSSLPTSIAIRDVLFNLLRNGIDGTDNSWTSGCA